MINITYSRRAFNKKGKHDIKKVIMLHTTNFTKYLERAKEFNKNFSNPLYISEVTDCQRNFTRCLHPEMEQTYSHFQINARDRKYEQIGNNPFDCIYSIPTQEFTDVLKDYQLEGY